VQSTGDVLEASLVYTRADRPGGTLNRDDFRELARLRYQEAKALLANALFSGAYYLGGYAVECALKAAIARQTRRYDFPDLSRTQSSHTHDLATLVRIAGLEKNLDAVLRSNSRFADNWYVVKDWTIQSRYQLHTRAEAHDLLVAIGSRTHGVMPWLRQHW
jgi:hypothetical protein